ncbi:MAG: hypothetical protein Fur0025_11790 [Oscillatoriaceae cyanobacterium]
MCAKGIDVSDWQDPVNWQTVALSGMGFGFTKATEGNNFVAETFRKNWAAMKAAGLPRGAYHFYRAKWDAPSQADLFLKTVSLEIDDLPPVLDIESTDGMSNSSIVSGITQWLNIVEQQTSRRPIIYTYPGFWETIGGPANFTAYPLWIAHYNVTNPLVPRGWDGWTFWQYTQNGKVDGIGGDVDINWFNVSREGDRGSHVQYIQTLLQNKGFYSDRADGIFGSRLTTAIIAFQNAMGLLADGVVGIKTWQALASKRQPATGVVVVPPPVAPPPVAPPPVAPPPAATPAIRLLDICRYYQGFAHQDLALDWLGRQLSKAVADEFARRWRNRTDANPQPISMVNVCKSYKGFPHQDRALLWLQEQLATSILQEFSRRWRNPQPRAVSQSMGIRLVNVAEYYQGLTHQNQALQWLQGQISLVNLQEFARRWRQQSPSTQTSTIQLIDVCRFYQRMLHQQQALDWLQTQINSETTDEFARRWRG